MFKKVLVANRGEIACRIIRACKELGIKTVAIYNEIESTARHVKMADEAYMIGVNPLDTYLNAERIVDLALEVGADAIHPGYGFLAENEHFARLCEEKGINFIGPHWKVIELMGDKARSKEIAKKTGPFSGCKKQGWSYFYKLLVSPLYGTIPFSKMYHIAILISQDLKLYMVRVFYIFLKQKVSSSKGL